MQQRRKAITWTQFYDSMSDQFCDHIDKKNGCNLERNIINSYFLCNECYEEYKKYSNPYNLMSREIGASRVKERKTI